MDFKLRDLHRSNYKKVPYNSTPSSGPPLVLGLSPKQDLKIRPCNGGEVTSILHFQVRSPRKLMHRRRKRHMKPNKLGVVVELN